MHYKNWRDNNLEKARANYKNWRLKNIERLRELKRKWRSENPSSGNNFALELKLVMNNVRNRDKNTCQWYNCKLTYKQTQIHVHHIFPRSEYPELELIEQYQICYCIYHHIEWHEARGDIKAVRLLKTQLNRLCKNQQMLK